MSCNPFMNDFMARFPHEGLTFDDVSLITSYADFLPEDVSLTSRLTTRIPLNIPLMSAAMDTVTESQMAIAMALLGGIGVIHKNMTPKAQVKHVDAVKHHLNGLILDPIVFHAHQTLGDVRERKERKGYAFSGFPILDENECLAGILTATDMKFAANGDVKVADIMTHDPVTAPPGTDIREAHRIMMEHKIGKLPIVKDGKLVGLYSFADVRTLIENAQPDYNRDSRYRLRVGAAVSQSDHKRAEMLAEAGVDVIVVDSAHGHTRGILDMVRWLVEHFPDIDVIAGNVATGEGAAAIRDAGAHAVKVGIGPGSICTTRVVCGVGVPQVTAVYECRKALGPDFPIIADGGIRHSGDVPKALASGADSVMLGSVLAGTEESPGEKIIHQGRQYVVYRGMGSLAAMRQSAGSRERYAQERQAEDDLVPQGIEGIVPYAGTVKRVMTQYCGGIRSSLGYCGCRGIDELQRRAKFVRVSVAGLYEAHPHDVKIMKEAPNYRS